MTLGITLGDVTGIGPEVALKAVARAMADDAETVYVLVGDAAVVRHFAGLLGIEAELPRWEHRVEVASRIYLFAAGPELPRELSAGHADAAKAALSWLRSGAAFCLAGEFHGLVTAPVSKEAIIRSGEPFVGQTEFLAERAGCHRYSMMLLGQDPRGCWLRVALATTHLPLRCVSAALTIPGLLQTFELTVEATRRLSLPRSRIAVCGLNPHAGEGGALGREEIEIIRPAADIARSRGWEVHGPFAADTLFYQAYRGDYDAVVAMYHDQGLVPLKMVAFDTGVNWTLGLPFVRTSPDHGTAYDIAGQGRADESSMLSAIRLARQLVAAP